jgi:type IV pilus assembly protein PilA
MAESGYVRPRQEGFSLIELLIVVAIILVIAAIAIPSFLRAKIAANQASAISSLRTIVSAAAMYSTTYGNGFPASFSTLGGSGTASCNSASLLDPLLSTAPNTKSGYQFNYQPEGLAIAIAAPGCGAGGYYGYLATATPTFNGITGQSSYCANEPGTLYFNSNGLAAGTPAACVAGSQLQ